MYTKTIGGTINSQYSSCKAVRIGNIVFAYVTFYYNYKANEKVTVYGSLNLNSLLKDGEKYTDSSYTIQCETLASDSSFVSATPNILISVYAEKALSKITIKAISNTSGVYMKYANVIYFISK